MSPHPSPTRRMKRPVQARRLWWRVAIPYFLPLLFSTLPVVVQAQFSYTTNNGTITITGYTGSGGDVTIPDTIGNLPVTSIGSSAFKKNPTLTTVSIPSTITNIGDNAFSFCTNLTHATFGYGVITIGSAAFFSCTALMDVTIPNSVTSIGSIAFGGSKLTTITVPSSVTNMANAAFSDCSQLASITVDPQNAHYSSSDGILFDKSQSLILQVPGGRVGSCAVPGTVRSIASSAFQYCRKLTSVAIPASVTNIGVQSFGACSSLISISVDTNNSLYASVEGVLFNRELTTIIACPGGKVGSYTISNGVVEIGDYGFYLCLGLTNIVIPESVTTIGRGGFFGCSSLTSILIPSSITTIGASAFGATALTSVTFPNSVTNIPDFAFAACRALTNVVIPESVTLIGTQSFSSSGLTSVDIPGSVVIIGGYAFWGCFKLTHVNFAFGATTIGDLSFSGCDSLTNVTLPNSVTRIGERAFNYCRGLTTVEIPGSVTNIGNSAFDSCTKLTSVFFKGNAPSLASAVFFGDPGATIYYLPGTIGWSTTVGGCPTALWKPVIQNDTYFGVQSNRFGFNIRWTSGMTVTVEACTDLANPSWSSLQTNTLIGDTVYFSDADWRNYPSRFYHLRWP